jgi:hypothetical protein
MRIRRADRAAAVSSTITSRLADRTRWCETEERDLVCRSEPRAPATFCQNTSRAPPRQGGRARRVRHWASAPVAPGRRDVVGMGLVVRVLIRVPRERIAATVAVGVGGGAAVAPPDFNQCGRHRASARLPPERVGGVVSALAPVVACLASPVPPGDPFSRCRFTLVRVRSCSCGTVCARGSFRLRPWVSVATFSRLGCAPSR